MSIYDKSSLVLIPSGTKTGKVYSQKPTNGDGDFTFTRSSAATRVNADGNIEKETGNLILQSNSFNTTWNVDTQVTLTSGQSGYDGTNNAWRFDKNNVTFKAIRQTPTFSGVVTFSVYAKEGTLRYLNFFHPPTAAQVWFDLQTGGFGSQLGDYIKNKIEDVGGGWYRCSVSMNASAGGELRLYPSSSSAGYTAVAGNIYIQDAQLEQGLVARDYIETTTSAVYGGITDNVPRLDYTDSSCPALLLEPQRTNSLAHSEYIAAGVTWSSASGMTTQNNSVISPEGVQNATKLIRPNSTGAAWVREGNISATIGLNQVISVFAKSGSNDILNMTYYDQTAGDLFFNYDLSNGTISSAPTSSAYYVDAGIEDYGNGWYRCYAIAESGRIDPQFQLSVGTNRGGAANSYLYIYGASHEKDVNYLSSYIPTYGSSVSRVQDLASFSYNAATTAWSIFMDVKNWTDVFNNGQFSLVNAANTINSLFYYGNCFGIQKEVGQAYFCSRLAVLGQSFNGKFAVIFDGVNTIKIYINGTLDSTSTLADTEKTLGIDSANLYYSGSAASKEIKSLLVFPTALTDQEAIDLTTI